MRGFGGSIALALPSCSHVHMRTVTHAHIATPPFLPSRPRDRLSPDWALAILAQDVVEGFGHQILKAETMAPGAGVQGE